jgi:hypothetical protein
VPYILSIPVLSAVTQTAFAAGTRAVGATKHLAPAFHAVTNDAAAAMAALGRHFLNCALKTIKDVRLAVLFDLECLVVFVPAVFALGHKFS